MKLMLTESALKDLRGIAGYTREIWGARQQQVYLDRLWEWFGEIQRDPSIHRCRADLFAGGRIATEGRHVILFREDGANLQIVRVLRSEMEMQTLGM